MVMVLSYGRTDPNMKAIGVVTKLTVKENWCMLTAIFMKVNGFLFSEGKGFGNVEELISVLTKKNIYCCYNLFQ